MSGKLILLLALTLILLPLPFLPGLAELIRRKDTKPLELSAAVKRDPRYFGKAFRNLLRPHLERVGSEPPYRVEVVLRRPEVLTIYGDLHVPAGSSEGVILAALGAAVVDRGARLRETYVRGDVRMGPGAVVRALAGDGDIVLDEGCQIDRWIDTEGNLLAGPGCNLGFSASAAGALRISPGCTFRRLYGKPIFARGEETREPSAEPSAGAGTESIEDQVVWGRRRLSLPRGFVLNGDLVSHTEVRIGAGSTILGTVKSHGPLLLGEGVRVRGNLISRKNITIGPKARIVGNVFCERDLSIGSGTQIGRKGTMKTVYVAGQVRMGTDVALLGWLIAERGGRIESS